MENNIEYNAMGSKVKEGFQCKPEKLDPNKPIMYFKSHLFLCDGERCKKACRIENYPKYVRELTKKLGIDRGKNRVKVSKVTCFGACRFGSVALIYDNPIAETSSVNSGLWLKKVQSFSEKEWCRILDHLSQDQSIKSILTEEQFINMQVFE